MSFSDDTALSAKKIAFLKQVPLFAQLNEQQLQIVTRDLMLREYGKGQIIFHQGDSGHELYVVMRGKVRIYRATPAGNETSLMIFAPGDILGEFAVIDQQLRSATSQAVTACSLLQYNAERFFEHARAMPELASGMMRVLVAKARWTAAYAETIAQYDAAGRLLHILVLLAERVGEEKEKGKSYVLDLGLNQSDLASLVGVRREWVNRLLQEWDKRGLVEYRSGTLTILDLPRMVKERDSRIEAKLEQEW